MIQPGSSKLPLSRLQEQGFQPSVRRAVPFVPLYRKASSEDAQQALDDGRDGVRLQKDSHSVTVASSDSAEVLATAMETDPRLDLSGLAKMKGVDQENALKGLKNQTPEKKARYLQMMADNFIAPGDWMGQLAQLQARENVTLFNERTGGLNGRIPTNSELKTLDQKGADHGIDYGYLTDGCYARGHLKCDTLRSEGVNRQKIFVEGSLTVKDGAVTVDGKRTDQHWSYHTAPLVLVEAESGAVDPKYGIPL